MNWRSQKRSKQVTKWTKLTHKPTLTKTQSHSTNMHTRLCLPDTVETLCFLILSTTSSWHHASKINKLVESVHVSSSHFHYQRKTASSSLARVVRQQDPSIANLCMQCDCDSQCESTLPHLAVAMVAAGAFATAWHRTHHPC